MGLTEIWEPDLENGSDFTRAARGPELLHVNKEAPCAPMESYWERLGVSASLAPWERSLGGTGKPSTTVAWVQRGFEALVFVWRYTRIGKWNMEGTVRYVLLIASTTRGERGSVKSKGIASGREVIRPKSCRIRAPCF
jgi:hypothetical protein